MCRILAKISGLSRCLSIMDSDLPMGREQL